LLLKRAIRLSILEILLLVLLGLSIGSQGRRNLLLTDQDSILVFEDVATEKYRG
jgi:CBS domain-containing protein